MPKILRDHCFWSLGISCCRMMSSTSWQCLTLGICALSRRNLYPRVVGQCRSTQSLNLQAFTLFDGKLQLWLWYTCTPWMLTWLTDYWIPRQCNDLHAVRGVGWLIILQLKPNQVACVGFVSTFCNRSNQFRSPQSCSGYCHCKWYECSVSEQTP